MQWYICNSHTRKNLMFRKACTAVRVSLSLAWFLFHRSTVTTFKIVCSFYHFYLIGITWKFLQTPLPISELRPLWSKLLVFIFCPSLYCQTYPFSLSIICLDQTKRACVCGTAFFLWVSFLKAIVDVAKPPDQLFQHPLQMFLSAIIGSIAQGFFL